MEGVTKKVLVVLAIFLTAFLSGAEGGRDLSTKGDDPEVYNPQAFRFPWFPHFPWWWGGIHESETGPKHKAKGEIRHMEVPQIGGMAGYGYLPQVDGMVSTKGEEIYNPQDFWFPPFPWWGRASTKLKSRLKEKPGTWKFPTLTVWLAMAIHE